MAKARARPKSGLPHEASAESAVLGSILLRNELFHDVSQELEAADFYIPAHRVLYECFERLSDRGEPIDIVTLEAMLTQRNEFGLLGGLEGLGKLTDRYSASQNVTHHVALIKQSAARRTIIIAAQSIAEDGLVTTDPEGFLERAKARLLDLGQGASLPRRTNGVHHKPATFVLHVTRAIDFDPDTPEDPFVWHPLVPDSTATLVVGRGSGGKSTFLAALCRRVGSSGKPSLWVRSEEPEKQVKRRMWGSPDDPPPTNVHVADLPEETPKTELLEQIELAIDRYELKMVVVDPITSWTLNMDAWREEQVRPFLEPWNRLAARKRVAIMLVKHDNKSGRGGAGAVGGSHAWTDVPRHVIRVAVSPTDVNDRAVWVVKTNLDSEGCAVGIGCKFGRKNGEKVATFSQPQTIREELYAERDLSKERRPTDNEATVESAATVIRGLLEDVPMVNAAEAYDAVMKTCKCSEGTLKRARARAGVIAVKRQNNWYWELQKK